MVWRLINHNVSNIFESMAIDEAMFIDTAQNKKPPTIRFYSTYPAAISIGYFQELEDISTKKCRAEGIDIVRRITGGKAVFHFNEITYCIVASNSEKIFPDSIARTYEIISQCLARGLGYLGIEAYLAEGGRTPAHQALGACCFSNPSKSELLVDGRKICGSAQIRKKGGFLQHGSLLTSFDSRRTAAFLLPARALEKSDNLNKSVTAIDQHIKAPIDVKDICEKIKTGFISKLGIELIEGKLTAEEEKMKNNLIKKYESAHWNVERIRKSDEV
ncbi:MAG: lipoate--protein ligase family protein [Syntrophaceae bacterium]|nr:lipoate--protein ligase family protein [Syntrophaceae bacterium]